MKPYRSMLFVPGHKASWADKGLASGADALILDLEDSVPAAEKDVARTVVAGTIDRLHAEGVRADLWVRPN
ncbi:aldolase/citrate lyase family protein, partial [Arthrobacter sp. NPDC058097]|uniref:aldolase/citrate lyase family protein n=1 Tax=Arthrobacter sp. NPDC058097 TaxID=3346340 RepID=UPI0036DC0518